MKKLMMFAAIAALAANAHARPMSTMEWMDPAGFPIWKGMLPEEKAESVKTMAMQSSSRKPDEQKFLIEKITACLDKEVADPDYNGSQIPLYIPWTSCMSKYAAILDNKVK